MDIPRYNGKQETRHFKHEVLITVSFIEDLPTSDALKQMASSFYQSIPAEPRVNKAMRNRVDLIASHMLKQYKEHEDALNNTNQMFYELLDELEALCDCFREAFTQRNIPSSRVFNEVDADRSVGIVHILWNALSFTTRGNTKPLAMYRPGRSPIFTGRILALNGDFHDVTMDIQDQEYPGILQYEVASLYVPADKTSPAVMTIKHLGDQEHYFHQSDAPKLFLLKTIEMICGGGYYHEKDF